MQSTPLCQTSPKLAPKLKANRNKLPPASLRGEAAPSRLGAEAKAGTQGKVFKGTEAPEDAAAPFGTRSSACAEQVLPPAEISVL